MTVSCEQYTGRSTERLESKRYSTATDKRPARPFSQRPGGTFCRSTRAFRRRLLFAPPGPVNGPNVLFVYRRTRQHYLLPVTTVVVKRRTEYVAGLRLLNRVPPLRMLPVGTEQTLSTLFERIVASIVPRVRTIWLTLSSKPTDVIFVRSVRFALRRPPVRETSRHLVDYGNQLGRTRIVRGKPTAIVFRFSVIKRITRTEKEKTGHITNK